MAPILSFGNQAGLTLETDVDAILPMQYADRRRRPLSPEQRLMAAVLEDALNIRRRGPRASGRRARLLYAEVRRWFASNDVQWQFSFVNVCQALGLEPSVIRSGARALDADASEWRIARAVTSPVVPARWPIERRDVATH